MTLPRCAKFKLSDAIVRSGVVTNVEYTNSGDRADVTLTFPIYFDEDFVAMDAVVASTYLNDKLLQALRFEMSATYRWEAQQ